MSRITDSFITKKFIKQSIAQVEDTLAVIKDHSPTEKTSNIAPLIPAQKCDPRKKRLNKQQATVK